MARKQREIGSARQGRRFGLAGRRGRKEAEEEGEGAFIVRFGIGEARDDSNKRQLRAWRSLLVEVHRGHEGIGIDVPGGRRAMLDFLQPELQLGAGWRPFGVEDFILELAEFILDDFSCAHVHHHQHFGLPWRNRVLKGYNGPATEKLNEYSNFNYLLFQRHAFAGRA
jgi:hypothetical protein